MWKLVIQILGEEIALLTVKMESRPAWRGGRAIPNHTLILVFLLNIMKLGMVPQ